MTLRLTMLITMKTKIMVLGMHTAGDCYGDGMIMTMLRLMLIFTHMLMLKLDTEGGTECWMLMLMQKVVMMI